MKSFKNIEDLNIKKNFKIIEDLSIGKISENEKRQKKDLILKEKYLKIHFQKLENLDNFKSPLKNEICFCITTKSFNAFTFIPYFLEREKINNILITTFNLSKGVILALGEFLQTGAIKNVYIIINKMMRYEHFDIIENMEYFKKTFSFDYKEIRNHSKINCIQTNDNYYIISGSGNFSNNNSYCEQYCIINNKSIFLDTVKYLKTL